MLRWSPGAFGTPPSEFPYPISPCPPIAIYAPYHAPSELPLSSVRTIAAPMSMIRQIDTKSWVPEYPIVAFSVLGDELLSEADREYIWQRFGVPSFEYLLDRNGHIIARECEAHEGMHTVDLSVLHEWEHLHDPCACGRGGSRVIVSRVAQPVEAIIG